MSVILFERLQGFILRKPGEVSMGIVVFRVVCEFPDKSDFVQPRHAPRIQQIAIVGISLGRNPTTQDFMRIGDQAVSMLCFIFAQQLELLVPLLVVGFWLPDESKVVQSPDFAWCKGLAAFP